MHCEGNGSASYEKKKTFKADPFFTPLLPANSIASVLALHIPYFFLLQIELKHPLSSETLLSLRGGRGTAMNNYASHGAPKWPHIFISASGVPCRRVEVAGREGRAEVGAGLRAPSASTVMYHTARPVLTVQLGAPPRRRPVSGNERRRAGQDQERLPQTHFRSRCHQSPLTATQWGGRREVDPAQDPCLIRLRPEGGIHPDQAGAERMSS